MHFMFVPNRQNDRQLRSVKSIVEAFGSAAIEQVDIIKIIARWLSACAVLAPAIGCAASLSITVTDKAGNAVPGIVAVAVPMQPVDSKPSTNAAPSVMDQRDLQFVPGILAIRTGTAVVFPNSDPISHQVYSFSPTKRFTLGLYRGQQHAPIAFDKPGVVVLGCNIHDNMLGYIYVTDSPYFGMTDDHGAWHATLPAGEYRLQLWTPRLDDPNGIEQTVHVDDSHASDVSLRITTPLRATAVTKPHDKRLRDY
jgi:plastocyanin